MLARERVTRGSSSFPASKRDERTKGKEDEGGKLSSGTSMRRALNNCSSLPSFHFSVEDTDGDASFTSSVLTNGGADSDRIWDTINEQSESFPFTRQTTFLSIRARSFVCSSTDSFLRPSAISRRTYILSRARVREALRVFRGSAAAGWSGRS